MKCLTLSLALTALAMVSTEVASATPFVDINFNADTIGNQPGTAPTSNPLLKPTGIGGYASTTVDPYGDSPPTADSGTLVVGNTGGMTKAAVFTTNPTDAEQGALYLDTGFSQAGQQVTLSFDLNIGNVPTTSSTQVKTLDGSGSVGLNFGINTFGTAQGVRFAAAATTATTGVFAIRSPDNTDLQSFFTYTEGQTYHVDLVGNYDTGLVSTYVNGAFTGDRAFAFGPAADVTTQEFFAFLNGDAGSANSIAIDNIVAAVPEPTTLAAIAGASSLLLRRRRA